MLGFEWLGRDLQTRALRVGGGESPTPIRLPQVQFQIGELPALDTHTHTFPTTGSPLTITEGDLLPGVEICYSETYALTFKTRRSRCWPATTITGVDLQV